MHSELKDLFSRLSSSSNASEATDAYFDRHGITAAPNLTVQDDGVASLIAQRLAPRIRDKVVVEIGGGAGLLSLHMAKIARRVYCIEANPMSAAMFAQFFWDRKPKNMSFCLGAADEFVGCIKADIAIICTHSGLQDMMLVGGQLARVVVDVYGERIEASPDSFDPWAREARKFA